MARNQYNPYGTQYEAPAGGATISPTMPPDGMMNNGAPTSPAAGSTPLTGRKNDGYIPTEADETTTPGETEYVDKYTVGKETIRPVVGWLVCTKGACKGKDFRLHSDRNYIGRGENLDIVIPDPKVSREASIQIAYDPYSRCFFVASCTGARQNSYYNNRLLLGDRELKTGDTLRLGDTELLFIPLCGENFAWDDSPLEQ